MHTETEGKDISILLDHYNREIDTLKSKLLNGVPWEELTTVRRNITELAIAIHKSHKHALPEFMPVEKTSTGTIGDKG